MLKVPCITAHGKSPQVVCQPVESSWWRTWMSVAGTI